MSIRSAPRGMINFVLIWFGQLVSIIGSGLTSFAIGVWVYQSTGSATKYAFISLCASLPTIVFSPLAGVAADRCDRRRLMILSDLGASLSTLALTFLFISGRLEVWHIYITSAVQSTASAFQWPAYSSSVIMLVPKRHLGRATGMLQFSQSAAQVIAPLMAGVLIASLQIWGVLLTDFATFLFAVSILLLVRIPNPERSVESEIAKGSWWRDIAYGWSYITTRPGLFGLLIFFAITNFMTGMFIVLLSPLILSFTSAAVLGVVVSVAGAGMLLGSLVMSIWGGPKRRINGVLGFELVAGVSIMFAGLRPSAKLTAIAAFVFTFCLPFVLGSSQAIWQSRVTPNVQGRVFAMRRMIAWSSLPLAYLVAGPLADYVFNPLLVAGGPLAGTIGRVTGVGWGRGIGLIFFIAGLCIVIMTVLGFMYSHLRLVEDELPDVIVDEALIKA